MCVQVSKIYAAFETRRAFGWSQNCIPPSPFPSLPPIIPQKCTFPVYTSQWTLLTNLVKLSCVCVLTAVEWIKLY